MAYIVLKHMDGDETVPFVYVYRDRMAAALAVAEDVRDDLETVDVRIDLNDVPKRLRIEGNRMHCADTDTTYHLHEVAIK